MEGYGSPLKSGTFAVSALPTPEQFLVHVTSRNHIFSITYKNLSPHGRTIVKYQKSPYWRIAARSARHILRHTLVVIDELGYVPPARGRRRTALPSDSVHSLEVLRRLYHTTNPSRSNAAPSWRTVARETVRNMLRYSAPPGYRREQAVKRPKLGRWLLQNRLQSRETRNRLYLVERISRGERI